LIILIVLCARYWKRNIEKKERDKAAINQQLAEFKMTALRSQMNPHFIYNAIGSIQHYILKNDIDQSFNYLSKFSSLIRKILNNSRNEYISLEDEISTLQLYIELEQIRFKHPFKFILTIDEKLDMYTDIPTMLIQPYIENSIWHGLMPKETEGRLELTFKKVEATVHIQIKDNGVGRETVEMKKKLHVSKGMSLTEQRIQTLENTSNKKFVTTIIDLKDEQGNPAGTEVNLIIPVDE
jgi:LytS/YehU family sensor histidine kinase